MGVTEAGGVSISSRKEREEARGRLIRRSLAWLLLVLFGIAGIPSLHFNTDVLAMILAAAWDLRHFAWVAFGASASFLSFILALYAYGLGNRAFPGRAPEESAA